MKRTNRQMMKFARQILCAGADGEVIRYVRNGVVHAASEQAGEYTMPIKMFYGWALEVKHDNEKGA
jgi:hypothetical protein